MFGFSFASKKIYWPNMFSNLNSIIKIIRRIVGCGGGDLTNIYT